MAKNKTKSSIYQYLRSKGVLDHGSHAEIQQARCEYWKEYKNKWRKEKRRKEKELTISLTNEELGLITHAAKTHKLSRTGFIKQSAFAYIQKSFIVPDIMEVRRITQFLGMTYNMIAQLLEDEKRNDMQIKDALQKIMSLEKEILPLLHNPKTLEEYITAHVKKNPQAKIYLTEFLKTI